MIGIGRGMWTWRIKNVSYEDDVGKLFHVFFFFFTFFLVFMYESEGTGMYLFFFKKVLVASFV